MRPSDALPLRVGEQETLRDNGRVEAILDLRVIEEQLWWLTYAVHELMRISWLALSRKKLLDLG